MYGNLNSIPLQEPRYRYAVPESEIERPTLEKSAMRVILRLAPLS